MNDGSNIDRLVDREVRWVPWSVKRTESDKSGDDNRTPNTINSNRQV